MEAIFAREGLDLARSTICGWHFELKSLVRPLLAAMREDAFQQAYLCTEATGVLVQHKEKCRTGHFWVLVAPGRHVLFEYTADHSSNAVDDVLAGYKGYLVADAHVVYDHLYKSGDLVEVNCWAHRRRYFFKALGSDPPRARVALDLIGALFRIERTIANSPRKKREAIRKKRSQPIVDSFLSWCDAEASKVLDDTPISDGIRYARNQRVGLARFLDDGRLPIHNNMSELALRREAVGRKNWLFVGNDEGGEVNAAFTSLLASCALHDVEPVVLELARLEERALHPADEPLDAPLLPAAARRAHLDADADVDDRLGERRIEGFSEYWILRYQCASRRAFRRASVRPLRDRHAPIRRASRA
ncbi:MAG: hypothetical protein NVS3B10_10310 [Polyangiales bacterium]